MAFDWSSLIPIMTTAAGAYYGGAEGAQAGNMVGGGLQNAVSDTPSQVQTTGNTTDQTPAAKPADGEFDWTQLIGPILTGATTLVGGIAKSDVENQQIKDKQKQQNLDQMLNLQLEALKAKHAIPSLPTPVWNPLSMKLGERASLQSGANLAQVNQLNNLMSSYQRAFGK